MHIHDDDGVVLVTATGRGWIFVPRTAWQAFTAAVKHGELNPARDTAPR
jgi:hypothetical protein